MSVDLALVDPAQVVAAADDPAAAVVVLLERAKAWLVEATNIKDIAHARAAAETIRVYTVQANLGRDAEQAACEMRLRAERRIGELLAKQQKHPPGPDRSTATTDLPPSLADQGISKDESSQFQRLASIPKRQFETRVADLRDEQKLSRAALLADAKRDREEQNAWVKSITPEGYDHGPDRQRQQVRFAIRSVLDAVEKLRSVATPAQVRKSLDADYDHVAAPLRSGLVKAARQLAKYEEV